MVKKNKNLKNIFGLIINYALPSIAPLILIIFFSSEIPIYIIQKQAEFNIFLNIAFNLLFFRYDVRVKDNKFLNLSFYSTVIFLFISLFYFGYVSLLAVFIFIIGNATMHKNSHGLVLKKYRFLFGLFQTILILLAVFFKMYDLIIYSFGLSFLAFCFLKEKVFLKNIYLNFSAVKKQIIPSLISIYLFFPTILILLGNLDQKGEQIIEFKIANIFGLFLNYVVFDIASSKIIKKEHFVRLLHYSLILIVCFPFGIYIIEFFMSYNISILRILLFLILSIISVAILFFSRRLQVLNTKEAFKFDTLRVISCFLTIPLFLVTQSIFLSLFILYVTNLIYLICKKIY
jgi:hypothetical protein